MRSKNPVHAHWPASSRLFEAKTLVGMAYAVSAELGLRSCIVLCFEEKHAFCFSGFSPKNSPCASSYRTPSIGAPHRSCNKVPPIANDMSRIVAWRTLALQTKQLAGCAPTLRGALRSKRKLRSSPRTRVTRANPSTEQRGSPKARSFRQL